MMQSRFERRGGTDDHLPDEPTKRFASNRDVRSRAGRGAAPHRDLRRCA